MLFYVLQIVISLAGYYMYRRNLLRYMTVITFAFFLAYFMSGSYDIALTLYYGFIIIELGIPEQMRPMDMIMCAGILLYTAAGILFQNPFAAVTALITRYGYILIFICLVSCEKEKKFRDADADDCRFMVRWGIMTEIAIIACVWMRDGMGARVVTNHQPIGAGIVIGLTVITGWCYIQKWFSASETMLYSIVYVVITILSGTRGYMVIIAGTMAVVMLVFFLDIPGNGSSVCFRIGAACVLIAFAAAGFLLLNYREVLVEVLRLDEGLGYRENENLFVKEIMKRAPWFNRFFGFGFGGNAQDVDGFQQASRIASWNRSYMYDKLLTRTIFHNYWYTILYKQGICGLILMVIFYFGVCRRILQMNASMWSKLLLFMMIVGNVISLTFRITATCSAFEMFLIGFIIKKQEADDSFLRKRGTENE